MTDFTRFMNESMNPFENYMEELGENCHKGCFQNQSNEEGETEVLHKKKLCEILHVSALTVIEMAKRGEIVEKRIGGRVLYDAAEIDEAVKEKKIFRYKRRKNDGS